LRDIQLKREAITAFWFPLTNSHRIKFILTSYGKNNAIEHFDKFNCKYINLEENFNEYSFESIIQQRFTIFYGSIFRESLICSELKDKFISILGNYPSNLRCSEEFVRSFIQFCMPHESQFLKAELKDSNFKKSDIERIVSKHDLQELSSI